MQGTSDFAIVPKQFAIVHKTLRNDCRFVLKGDPVRLTNVGRERGKDRKTSLDGVPDNFQPLGNEVVDLGFLLGYPENQTKQLENSSEKLVLGRH